MTGAAGERSDLVRFGLGHFPWIHAGDAAAVDVHLHHDPVRLSRHLLEHRLEDVHHELHRRVVVVEQDHRVLRRFLSLDVDPFLDGAICALFAVCHSRKYTICLMTTRVGAAMLVAVLAPAALAGQRKADAQPDLSGTWGFSTLTPLERPAEFAGKDSV